MILFETCAYYRSKKLRMAGEMAFLNTIPVILVEGEPQVLDVYKLYRVSVTLNNTLLTHSSLSCVSIRTSM